MDFSTIKNQMDAKDGTGYKHVMQIYADMRLVFENAMKYNEEASDVYSMAKTLLQKFEEKWAHFLPKVLEEVNGLIDRFICFFLMDHWTLAPMLLITGENTGGRGEAISNGGAASKRSISYQNN